MSGYIQSTGLDTSGTVNLAFGSNVAAHSTLVVFARVGLPSGTVTSVTDNVNGAWSKRFSQDNIAEGDSLDCWYFLNAGAGATTVTVNLSSSASLRFCIAEGALGSGGGLVDASNSAEDGGSHSSNENSGNIITADAVEWLVAGSGLGGADTFAAGSGWTLRSTPGPGGPSDNGNGKVALEEQLTASSGTYAGTFTTSGPNDPNAWTCGVIAFKAAAGAAAPLGQSWQQHGAMGALLAA